MLASLIWASTPIFVKYSLSLNVNPLSIAFLRIFFSIILFSFIIKSIKINRDIIILGTFGLGLNFLSYHAGLYFTTSAAAQFIESLAIIFVIFFSKIFKFYIKRNEYIAAALAIFGMFLIFHSHRMFKEFLFGDFLELIAAISWAFFIVKSKELLKKMNETHLLFNVYIISAILLSPSIIIFKTNLHGLFISLLMAFLHTIVAYTLYYKGIKEVSPIVAAISFNLSPVFTLIFSKIFLNEFINLEFLIGCTLIFIGLLISSKK